MIDQISTKENSFKLYEAGEFGNKLRTWHNVYELKEDEYQGTVTMRYASKYGKWCQYDVPQDMIRGILFDWEVEGADIRKIRFNESAPDDHLFIQGEIKEDPEYKYILNYSTAKVKMREAMQNPQELLGRDALHRVQEHLSLASMRNLKRLFATYPYAVIEFSTYDHFLGDTPKNNTIFWEVRNY